MNLNLTKSQITDTNYLRTLETVRYLSSKHNLPKDTPKPKIVAMLPVQILGWKSNTYVLQLLKEIPIDSSNLQRSNNGKGNWIFRKQVNGKKYELSTETTCLAEAIKIRDKELERIKALQRQ